MFLSQFPLTSHQIQNRMPRFIAYLRTILVLIGMVFVMIREMFHGRISLNLVLPAAASEFCVWVQVGIDVYIPHRNNQVKPHSSPWFSAACPVPIVHRNHFFHLYQKDKSSDSKIKFRQVANPCKRVLESAKLADANKTKEYYFPETWLS